jgi:rRNA-processing protein FCF1
MMLREGATAAAAAEVLRVAQIEVHNAHNAPHLGVIRDSYMETVGKFEGQLGNAFDRASVSELLHTTNYWFIAQNWVSTGMPQLSTINHAVSREIEALEERIKGAYGEFSALAKWFELPGLITVVDTNVLMNCEPLDTIDWPEVPGIGRGVAPRLIVPLSVVEELDRKKFEGGDKPRARAAKAISVLHRLRGSVGVDDPADVVRGGKKVATLEIPHHDIGRARLASTDDELIDFGVFLKRAGDRTVVLVTRDLNLQIKARRGGLDVAWMPDRYLKDKAPAEPEGPVVAR